METSSKEKVMIRPLSRYILMFLLLILGFGFGILFDKSLIKNAFISEVRLPQQYKYINPLLECDSNIGNYKSLTKTEDSVSSYIKDAKDRGTITSASVYYRDLNNGPWFGINEQEKFTPASLIKVPMMIAYFKRAETDPDILSKKLIFSSKDQISLGPAFVKPKEELIEGQEYTVMELVEIMIKFSNNNAYYLLKSNLGEDRFEQTLKDFGIDVAKINSSNTENVLTIREYSSFFRILYNSSYLSRAYSERALEILSGVEFKSGISAGIPESVLVANKFGERSYQDSSIKQLHDCGIVYKTNNPYLVCIMTRGGTFDDLANSIRDISKIIYSSLN